MLKRSAEDLAIFGGTPAFHEKVHVGRPNIGDRDRLMGRINSILDGRWLSNDGPFVREFESRLATLVDAKHCIAMCNGTIALEIAIRALDLTGEVIVPAFTFIATAHALQWQGITPVFCDVDPETHLIDPAQVEKMITPRTTGIVGVHLWGQGCDVEALAEIARRRKLRLMFDAAHAVGCSHKGRMIGNFGDAEVFSFHATKFLNSFEGGAVVTNNDELAEKIRLMRNFGFAGFDNVVSIGTNGKMTEVSAAMGLTGLESFQDFVGANHRNYRLYRQLLEAVPGVSLYTYDDSEKCNFQYVVLTIDEQSTGLSRDQLVQLLQAENVIARRYFYPGAHRMEPYRTQFPLAGVHLPRTEWLTHRVMALPTGTAVGVDEIHVICDLLRFAVDHAPDVRERLDRSPVAV